MAWHKLANSIQALYKINKYGNSFRSRSISEMSGNAEHLITKRRLGELIQKCDHGNTLNQNDRKRLLNNNMIVTFRSNFTFPLKKKKR